jgi:hypothetical protein
MADAASPEAARIIAATDAAGGHAHIRHEGWVTEEDNRRRVAQILAKREGEPRMRVFKSELREALRDPSQLPGDELSRSVQYEDGSPEAFLRPLWHDLYGDEPPEGTDAPSA